jgi:hypothetical protein
MPGKNSTGEKSHKQEKNINQDHPKHTLSRGRDIVPEKRGSSAIDMDSSCYYIRSCRL